MSLYRLLFAPPSNPPDRLLEERRSFALTIVNGILFLFAESLMDPVLVLVSFASHLTSSPLLLGLIAPLYTGSWSLPQLWISGYQQNRPVKIDLYRRTSFVRMAAWGVLAASINFIENRSLLLVAFFVTVFVSSLASGVGGLPFQEVVGKMIPPAQRGEVYAWRFGLGGLLGVAGSVLVRWVISPTPPLPFPHNYGLLAFGFFFFGSISLLTFNAIREPPDPVVLPRQGLLPQARRAWALLRGLSLSRRLLMTQGLMLTAGAATPFFAVFLQKELGGESSWVGVYLGVGMVTNLAANFVFGRVSRHVDNQKVLAAAAVAGTLMSALVVLLAVLARPLGLSPLAASIWLLPVFALNSIRTTGQGIGFNSLLLNLAPIEDRSVVIGFSQTLLGMLILLTGLSGVLVGLFGYLALFALALLAHATALWLALRLRDIRE